MSGGIKELLDPWRARSDRRAQRLFFAQVEAAERRVAAVNRVGDSGTGRYLVVQDPPTITKSLDKLSGTPQLA